MLPLTALSKVASSGIIRAQIRIPSSIPSRMLQDRVATLKPFAPWLADSRIEILRSQFSTAKAEAKRKIAEEKQRRLYPYLADQQAAAAQEAVRAKATKAELSEKRKYFGLIMPEQWADEELRREWVDWFGNKVQYPSWQVPEKWLHLTEKHLKDNAPGLLEYFDGNMLKLMQSLFPNYPWPAWLFSPNDVPKSWWNSTENQKAVLMFLAEHDFKIPKYKSEWQNFDPRELRNIGVGRLLDLYDGSLLDLLQRLYPDDDWQIWMLSPTYVMPPDFWNVKENRKEYLEWLGKKLGFVELTDWYALTDDDLIRNFGNKLLKDVYKNEIHTLLSDTLDYKFEPQKFANDLWWKDRENQKWALEKFKQMQGIETPEDWLDVPLEEWTKFGIHHLLRRYGNNQISLLNDHYGENGSEYVQMDFHVAKNDPGYWNQPSNVRKFMFYLTGEFGIQHLEQWYDISALKVKHHGGNVLLQHKGGMLQLLQEQYPEHEWDETKFKSLAQDRGREQLMRSCRTIFPLGHEVFLDYEHPEFVFSETGKPMKFDVFVPSLNIAVDYRSQKYFLWTPLYGAYDSYHRLAEEKRKACQDAGITLIEIPFWWNKSRSALGLTILRSSPELQLNKFKPFGKAVDEAMPTNLQNYLTESLDVIESKVVASARPVLLTSGLHFAYPQYWPEDADPTGWWVSEKFNGVRAGWTEDRRLISESGRVFFPPDSFLVKFPDELPMDGELWVDYEDSQQKAIRVVSEANQTAWSDIKFMLFDLPTHQHLKAERRIGLIDKIKDKVDQKVIKVVPHVQCKSKEHLMEMYNEVLAKGGEGLCLRKNSSFYHSPNSFYKLQPFRDDEALVTEFRSGELLCTLAPSMKLLPIKVEQEIQPKLGTVISFKYDGVDPQSGLPTNPQFLNARDDLRWSDVLSKKLPYKLAVGERTGGNPKCKGCGHEFIGRDKLRIVAIGTHVPLGTGPQVTKLYFCVSSKCIREAIASKQNMMTTFPPFENLLGVPQELKSRDIPDDMIHIVI
eukprot:TRINITY_DN7423_c0_g1_i1.p1 TRINITY_DN7423_c0_g1~~TRINITY_DN7423_c0_g1_i1.p1  ORF type:complete len:1013 (-),score=259.24 TRINITY_DN7423_c0_g1_i1:4-3042(-)